MSNKHYQINITKPCQQKWEAMQNAEQGRFCGQCAKTVLDFTQLSDEEIIKVMEQSNGKICGRFQKQQLNREIPFIPITSILPKRLRWFSGLLLLGTAGTVMAQENTIKNATTQEAKTIKQKNADENLKATKDSVKAVIRGSVTDKETGEQLPGLVSVRGTTYAVLTDENGNFALTIPNVYDGRNVVLVLDYIGYSTAYHTVEVKDFAKYQYIKLSAFEETILGGPQISLYRKKKWWQFWKW